MISPRGCINPYNLCPVMCTREKGRDLTREGMDGGLSGCVACGRWIRVSAWHVAAQQTGELGRPLATSPEGYTYIYDVAELPDGRILLTDSREQAIVRLSTTRPGRPRSRAGLPLGPGHGSGRLARCGMQYARGRGDAGRCPCRWAMPGRSCPTALSSALSETTTTSHGRLRLVIAVGPRQCPTASGRWAALATRLGLPCPVRTASRATRPYSSR